MIFKFINKKAKEIKQKYFTQKPKVGVSYNLFDGIELLEASIKSIRNQVDYINITYQSISNFKEEAPKENELILNNLKEKGLVDNIIYYTPNFEITPQKNELAKRNIGLKDCIKNKCTHFLTMDTDEFYDAEQFQTAKEYIFKNKIEQTSCLMLYYVKEPIYRFRNTKDNLFVPFICKINKNSQIKLKPNFCRTDATRMVYKKKAKCYVFVPKELVMHHMAYVRNDLEKKFRNSTCRQDPNQNEKLASIYENAFNYEFPNDFYFYNEGYYAMIKVEDKFNVYEGLKR